MQLKTIVLVCLFSILGSSLTKAQDTLYLKKGGKMLVGKIEIHNLEIDNYKFKRPKISLNGKAYFPNKVRSFVHNGEYYANIMNKLFAKATYAGKINAFYVSLTAMRNGVEVNSHPDFMIQEGRTGKIMQIGIRPLKVMMASSPELVQELEEIGYPKPSITSRSKANIKIVDYAWDLVRVVVKFNKLP